jgi:hypothetical protein
MKSFFTKHQVIKESDFVSKSIHETTAALSDTSVYTKLYQLHLALSNGEALFCNPNKKNKASGEEAAVRSYMTTKVAQVLMHAKKEIPRWNSTARTNALEFMLSNKSKLYSIFKEKWPRVDVWLTKLIAKELVWSTVASTHGFKDSGDVLEFDFDKIKPGFKVKVGFRDVLPGTPLEAAHFDWSKLFSSQFELLSS